MKSMTQKFLALSLLISLPGCFDFGCCKKNNVAATESNEAQTATPKEHCSHAGCTHDHSNDQALEHAVVAEHADVVANEEQVAAEQPETVSEQMNSDEK